MGTKTTAKDMVELCDELLLIRGWADVEDVKKVTKKLDSLTAMTYNEARAEEIIKKIIERSKHDLINLIKEDEAFTRDEAEAMEIMQYVKVLRKELKSESETVGSNMSSLHNIVSAINIIKGLLQKDADIADAVQIVARDLEKLMQTLQKTEK